ncbi:MAG TPA: ATP-binding protein, partial [Thermoanaerobaculia bacterium]|nr:ATP-binding protein [Thermoanaerobaculia bacterium]
MVASQLRTEIDADDAAPQRRESSSAPITLRRRLLGLLLRWFVLFLVVAIIVGAWMLGQVRSWMTEGHRLLAETVAEYVDATLSDALRDLERVSTELGEVDHNAGPRLRAARLRSVFNHSIYIIDADGEVIVSDPAMTRAPTPEWRRAMVGHTGVSSRSESPSALIAARTFRKNGQLYSLIAEAQPTGSGLSTMLQDLASDPSLHLVIVDSDARVIAAPNQRQIGRGMHTIPGLLERIEARRPLIAENSHCPLCAYDGGLDARNLMVMVPLDVAPWSIIVQQHEPSILSLAETFLVGFFSVTAILGLMGLLLSRSFSQSVILPIQDLSMQAETLREGNLETPIEVAGDLEIQVLADSFNDARKKIRASMDQMRSLNEDLEIQVDQRTDELRSRIEDLRILLEISTLAGRERDPEIFVPEALDQIEAKFDLDGVVLIVIDEETSAPRVFTTPDATLPPWIEEGADPPKDWQTRQLVHLDRKHGDIFYRGGPQPDHPLLDAMCREIAGALHSASLLDRILSHDARRQELVRQLLRAGEEERRRIARELHDEISQLLTVIQISLEQVQSGETTEVEHTLDILGRTQTEVHRIIHDLRPTLLDDLGLPAAVKWYAESDLLRRGIQVDFEVEDELDLPEEIEITAFRILQECITNILRHAKAQNVSIELFRTADRLELMVEDDGIGFNPRTHQDGAGLTGMKERAALVGGRIQIDSDPEQGTSVHLTIPLENG